MPWLTTLPSQVALLAERLHHQLLQVAREQQQAVLVGQDHHVLLAAAVGRPSATSAPAARPGSACVIAAARHLVHRARAREHRVDVDALQRGGQQADRDSSLVRPPTQSHIGKRASQPSLLGELVQLGAVAGDGDRVLAEVEPRLLVGAPRPRACRCASPCVPPDLRDDDASASRRAGSPSAPKTRAMPSGSVLSKKCTLQLVARGRPAPSCDELRAQRRAADADDQQRA